MFILEWFAFMSLGWWVLSSAVLIILFITIAQESFWFDTVLIGYFVFMYFTNPQWYQFNGQLNWIAICIAVFSYFVIGILWSLFKTHLYVKDNIRVLDFGGNVIDASDHQHAFIYKVWPKVIFWAANWPMSITVYILTSLVGDIWTSIMNKLKSLYESIYMNAIESKTNAELAIRKKFEED